MNNILFFHSKVARNRVTIAAIVEDGVVKFGAARCSKRDAFQKKIGRLIAEGRARKNPIRHANPPYENLNKWFVLQAQELAAEVQQSPELLCR